jgi:hypothetical protein
MPQHFAFLRKSEITNKLKASLTTSNVRIITYKEHTEIPGLLKKIYISNPDFSEIVQVENKSEKRKKKFTLLTPEQYWKKLLLNKQYVPSGYDLE